MIDEFFKFAYSFKDFEKKDIFEYIANVITRSNNEIDDVVINNTIENINRVYTLFLMHLKVNDKLLPFKKDYFI